MKTIQLKLYSLIFLLAILNSSYAIYDGSSNCQKIDEGHWKGLKTLFIPKVNMYCFYSLDYQGDNQSQMYGTPQLIYESQRGICEQYHYDLVLQHQCQQGNVEQINTQYSYDPDLYGIKINNQLNFLNSEIGKLYQRYYSMTLVDTLDTDIKSQNLLKSVQSFYGQNSNCYDLRGDWSGQLVQISEQKKQVCSYDIQVEIDTLKRETFKLVAKSTRFNRGFNQEKINSFAKDNLLPCFENKDIEIELIGFCDEKKRTLNLNEDDYQGLFSSELIVLQSLNQQLTITKD